VPSEGAREGRGKEGGEADLQKCWRSESRGVERGVDGKGELMERRRKRVAAFHQAFACAFVRAVDVFVSVFVSIVPFLLSLLPTSMLCVMLFCRSLFAVCFCVS